MNPNQAVEECECGHEEGDHGDFWTDEHKDEVEPDGQLCLARCCKCEEYRPKDAQYYADLADEAKLARWEGDRY